MAFTRLLAAGLTLMLLTHGAAGARAAEAVKLLAFGDSLVHGYGLAAGDSFPDQLQQYFQQAPPSGNYGQEWAEYGQWYSE